MCGQVGIIFGKKRRRITEREYLNEVFVRMLLCSEERGPHASGMAWLRTDGDFRLFKRPIRAHRLVRESTFHELMAEVDNQTTILMGHTRWRTRGNEFNNRNNHPSGPGSSSAPQGTIYSANYLFRRLGLRCAEVDGELHSGWPTASLKAPSEGAEEGARPVAARWPFGLASTRHYYRAQGNKPLCLRIHRQHRVGLRLGRRLYRLCRG